MKFVKKVRGIRSCGVDRTNNARMAHDGLDLLGRMPDSHNSYFLAALGVRCED